MMQVMLVTALLTAIIGWPVLLLLRRLGVSQTISEYVPEHRGKQGTPTAGGLMMLLASLAVWGLAVRTGDWEPRPPDYAVLWFTLIGGFALIGLLDDVVLPRLTKKRGLGWIPKLVLQFAVAVPVCAAYLQSRGGTSWLVGTDLAAVPAAAFIVVGVANAVNFTDGMDGLAAGVMVLASIGLFMGGGNAFFCAVLVGCALGFLVYNAPPARLFMGDTGSLMLGAGFGFALLAQPQATSWLLLLLSVFMVELVPVPLQILWVKLFKRRLFLRTPIHHAFQYAGVPERRVVAGFLVVQAACTLAYGVLVR